MGLRVRGKESGVDGLASAGGGQRGGSSKGEQGGRYGGCLRPRTETKDEMREF